MLELKAATRQTVPTAVAKGWKCMIDDGGKPRILNRKHCTTAGQMLYIAHSQF